MWNSVVIIKAAEASPKQFANLRMSQVSVLVDEMRKLPEIHLSTANDFFLHLEKLGKNTEMHASKEEKEAEDLDETEDS